MLTLYKLTAAKTEESPQRKFIPFFFFFWEGCVWFFFLSLGPIQRVFWSWRALWSRQQKHVLVFWSHSAIRTSAHNYASASPWLWVKGRRREEISHCVGAVHILVPSFPNPSFPKGQTRVNPIETKKTARSAWDFSLSMELLLKSYQFGLSKPSKPLILLIMANGASARLILFFHWTLICLKPSLTFCGSIIEAVDWASWKR